MDVDLKVTESNCYRLLPPQICNEVDYRDILLQHAKKILSIDSLEYDTMVYDGFEYKTIWYPEADLKVKDKIVKVPMLRVYKYTYTPGYLYGRYKKHETVLELIMYPKDIY